MRNASDEGEGVLMIDARQGNDGMISYANVRPQLLGGLDGTVLEIGPGSGVNLQYYRAGIRWIGVEPNVSLHERIVHQAAQRGLPARILTGVAERITLPDASVDAVVGTLVLCSVDDQARALAEVRRVLKPSGRYVFDEHVAAPTGTWTRRIQEVWTPLARRIEGCNANRDTGRAIERAGFGAVAYERFALPAPFGFTAPHIAGTALK